MKKFIIPIIGFILIAAVLVTTFSLFNKVDDTIDDVQKNTADTNSGATDSGLIFQNFYISGDVGYKTVDNVTTFFVVVPNFLVGSVNNYDDGSKCSGTSEGGMCNFSFKREDVDIYDNLEFYPYMSADNGNTWSDMTTESGYFATIGVSCKEVYLGYTQIENCENPLKYLADMKTYAFRTTNRKVCEGCDASYHSYNGYDFTAYHDAMKG